MRADALLGSTDKVTSLAALADSADYLADVISRSGAVDVSGGAGPRASSPTKSGGARDRDGQPGGALTVGMAHLMDRCASWQGTRDMCTKGSLPLNHWGPQDTYIGGENLMDRCAAWHGSGTCALWFLTSQP